MAHALPLRIGTVQAWLTPTPSTTASGQVWLVASIAPHRVTIADWDLAQAAQTCPDAAEAARLAEAYSRSRTLWHTYRLGQFRRPEALIHGGVSPDCLAPLDRVVASTDPGAAYAYQLCRALRALVGAPPDTPLSALVAAVVARGRARLLATYHDNIDVYLYSVDNNAWYFTLDNAFNQMTALPYAGSPRING